MEIDEDDRGLSSETFYLLEGDREGIVENRHEGSALEIDDGDRGEVGLVADKGPLTDDTCRIIEGAEQSGFLRE
jgi:hypothetical protein